MKNLNNQSKKRLSSNARLKQKFNESKDANWLKENINAIQAYNNFIEKHGLFGDEYRLF